MAVKDQITADLKEAMKARDQVRLDTLRSVLSAFTYKRVEAGHDPTDDEQLALVQKLVKQRNDSITEFGKAAARMSRREPNPPFPSPGKTET